MFNLANKEKPRNVQEMIEPGFEEVPQDDWLNLEVGTFVKYQKQDGTVVRGGYIVEKRFADQSIILRSDKTSNDAKTWRTPISTISKLWKKRQNEEIDLLADMMKTINDRLISLETKNSSSDVFETVAKLESLTMRVSQIELDIKNLHKYLQEFGEYVDKYMAVPRR